MLGWRLLISAVLVPALFGVFYWDHRVGEPAWVLLALCVPLAARAVWELTALLAHRGLRVHLPTAIACCWGVVGAAWWNVIGGSAAESLDGPAAVAVAYSLSVLVLLAKGAREFREPGRSMQTLGTELLVVSYIGVLLATTAQLRWVAGAQAGYLVLGSLVIAAKAGDVGAYTVGKLFGKRKMVPRLSPGKTWAGAGGALCGAALGALTWLEIATPYFGDGWSPPPVAWSLIYGVCIGAVGLVGDLAESLIKRDVEVKDSAALLPGFGGLLDLLDSVLYAGPVAYLLWLVLPLQTW